MASLVTPTAPFPRIGVGARVQVFCRFDGRWVSGFVLSAFDGDTLQVRVKRLSDGSELPAVFSLADVRPDAAG